MGALALLGIAIQLIKLAPQLKAGADEIIAAAKAIWKIASDEAPPTTAQAAEYTAALDAAHKALQDS